MSRDLPKERRLLKRREAKKMAYGLVALWLERKFRGLSDGQVGELVHRELDLLPEESRLVAAYLKDVAAMLRRRKGEEWLPTRGNGS